MQGKNIRKQRKQKRKTKLYTSYLLVLLFAILILPMFLPYQVVSSSLLLIVDHSNNKANRYVIVADRVR